MSSVDKPGEAGVAVSQARPPVVKPFALQLEELTVQIQQLRLSGLNRLTVQEERPGCGPGRGFR